MNDWRWRWWQEVCAKEMQFYENEYGRRSLLSRRRNIIAITHTTINARVVYIIIINKMKIQFVHAEEKWLKFVVHLSQGDQQSVSQTGLARRRLRRRTATSGCVLGLLRVIQSRYLFASLGAFSPRDSRFNVVGTARCVYRFLGCGRQSFSRAGEKGIWLVGNNRVAWYYCWTLQRRRTEELIDPHRLTSFIGWCSWFYVVTPLLRVLWYVEVTLIQY